MVALGAAWLGRRSRHTCLCAFPAQSASPRAHLHRQEGARLHGASLRLSRHGADPLLRESHRDAESVVVLLGRARLGSWRRLPGLVHVLETPSQAAVAKFDARGSDDGNRLQADKEASQKDAGETLASTQILKAPFSLSE